MSIIVICFVAKTMALDGFPTGNMKENDVEIAVASISDIGLYCQSPTWSSYSPTHFKIAEKIIYIVIKSDGERVLLVPDLVGIIICLSTSVKNTSHSTGYHCTALLSGDGGGGKGHPQGRAPLRRSCRLSCASACRSTVFSRTLP